LDEGLQFLGYGLRDPSLQASLHLLTVRGGEVLVGENGNRRLQRIIARLQLRDLLLLPQNHAALSQLEGIRLCGSYASRAHRKLASKHLRCGSARRLAVNALAAAGIGRKTKSLQTTDVVVLDVDRSVLGDVGVQLVLVAHALHQRARAQIDEALRQA